MTTLATDGQQHWLDIKKLVCALLSESVTVPIWGYVIPSNSSSFLTGIQEEGLVCADDQPSTMCICICGMRKGNKVRMG
jgi:hypothetical protein